MGSRSLLEIIRPGLAAVLIIATGCSMRVTGVVRDGTTGDPIGGAVLTADDGRNRLCTTDPLGRYTVKTSWKPTSLTVSAPGYQAVTVPVPGQERFSFLYVDLQRAFPVAPVAAPVYDADPTATKLRELQDLHDQGLISEAEYKRTRSRIVGDF